MLFAGVPKETFIFESVLKNLLSCSFDVIFRLFRSVSVELAGKNYQKFINKSTKSYKNSFL